MPKQEKHIKTHNCRALDNSKLILKRRKKVSGKHYSIPTFKPSWALGQCYFIFKL